MIGSSLDFQRRQVRDYPRGGQNQTVTVDARRERCIKDLGHTFRQGLPQVVGIAVIRIRRLGKQ